jgi:hypothetical protein
MSQKLARQPSSSSLGSTTDSSAGSLVEQAAPTPRLSSRQPELARRARARRDWTPPTWKAPLAARDRAFLVAYVVLYVALWLALFGQDAYHQYGAAASAKHGRSGGRASAPLADDLATQGRCVSACALASGPKLSAATTPATATVDAVRGDEPCPGSGARPPKCPAADIEGAGSCRAQRRVSR